MFGCFETVEDLHFKARGISATADRTERPLLQELQERSLELLRANRPIPDELIDEVLGLTAAAS